MAKPTTNTTKKLKERLNFNEMKATSIRQNETGFIQNETELSGNTDFVKSVAPPQHVQNNSNSYLYHSLIGFSVLAVCGMFCFSRRKSLHSGYEHIKSQQEDDLFGSPRRLNKN